MKALAPLLFFILPLGTIASPTHRSIELGPRDVPAAGLSPLETQHETRAIIPTFKVIKAVVDEVLDFIASIKAEKDREIAFIDKSIVRLTKKYPAYNVLVYHDDPDKDKSKRGVVKKGDANTWTCQHVERERTFGTKGYEVCLVKRGKFVRGKDQEGGTRNWGWRTGKTACVKRKDVRTLEFCEIR